MSSCGTFHLKKAENISYLYFPIAGEAGLKSSFTPNLGGDAKIDQNTFLLEPVSAENLVNNRNSRNFWCNVKGIGSWSLTGNAAEALSKKFTEMQDDSEVTAGFMWQKTTRESKKYQLRGEILSFIPVEKNVEVMLVTITPRLTNKATVEQCLYDIKKLVDEYRFADYETLEYTAEIEYLNKKTNKINTYMAVQFKVDQTVLGWLRDDVIHATELLDYVDDLMIHQTLQ